jgi:DUF971 family protein
MSILPSELSLIAPDRLQIVWSDGQVRQYTVRELRENCPCATCMEKRSVAESPAMLPILRAEETQPLRITKMESMGHYAYGIAFSDGHDTGLYTLELLRTLGTVDPQS